MKVLFIVYLVFEVTNAVRVPVKWPDGPVYHKKTLVPFNHAEYIHRLHKFDKLDRPYKHKPNIHSFQGQKFKRRKVIPAFQKKKYPKPVKKFPAMTDTFNQWVPIAPHSINTKLGYMAPKPDIKFDLRQLPKVFYNRTPRNYDTSKNSPIHKNYRDDKTHEADDDKADYIEESTSKIEKPSVGGVKSEHEEPLDIPTVPIYPGEGQWAKPNKKHKPFISKHKFTDLKEEDSEEKQDGYETFEEGETLFNKKLQNFENISRRKARKQNLKHQEESENEKDPKVSEDEENVDEFVPITMYAQVRRSENEEHLPSDSESSEGGRLKEVIKDSKIQTVYTEEGYEDSAYDHAGHEKEAEDSQSYKEYNKEEEDRKKQPKFHSKKQNSDQDQDGSNKIKKIVEFVKPNKLKTTHKKSPNEKYPYKNKNNFMKTKETKTVEVKASSDGTQMEITSEVKVSRSPENGTEFEKPIIEIMPKSIIYSNISTQPNKTVVNQLNSPNDSLLLPTVEQISKKLQRKKRYMNDFPKISVSTDFLDDIDQSNLPKYKNQMKDNKYPYYKAEYIDENSALRYSENLDNIPKKIEGEMSFYEQSDNIECPGVDADFEKISKRAKEVEESVNDGDKLENSEEREKSPRLGKLGQRIDCFKRKYFGENPLDSPLFEEKEIAPVRPILKVFEKKSAGFQIHHTKPLEMAKQSNLLDRKRSNKYHSKFSIQNIKNNIRDDPLIATNEKIRNLLSNTENEELEPKSIITDTSYLKVDDSNEDLPVEMLPKLKQTSPDVEIINVDSFKSINRITTEIPNEDPIISSDNSLDIPPKHIYDQIKLLEHLPSSTTEMSDVTPRTDNWRQGKLVEENSEHFSESAQLQMQPNSHTNKFKRRQRLRRKKPLQTFNINEYLQNQPGRIGSITRTAQSTQKKTLYDENIMPLEQLNVFADVLNNIKNGTNDPLRAAATSFYKPSKINGFHSPTIKMRVPPRKMHIKKFNPDISKVINDKNLFYLTSTTTSTTTTTTKKPRRGVLKYASTTDRDYDDEYTYIDHENIYGRKENSVKKSTTPPPVVEEEYEEEIDDSDISETETTETIQPIAQKLADIVGLVPPSKWHYRTIYQPVEELPSELEVSGSEVINTYYVAGMKPPSSEQRVYQYSDFQKLKPGQNFHRYRKRSNGRIKRSPNRMSYFEVVRSQNSGNTEASINDDDDDYVPHRPKNWHWDENLKKIVYDNPKKEEQVDENNDEDIVETEIEEIIPRVTEQTTTRFKFPTTPINGPSYVDFVNILKKNKDYVSIPDPTTMKNDIRDNDSSTVATTTVKSGSTKLPEFLSILSKVRQSDSYMLIEEKNKTRSTVTTEAIEVNKEDIDETEPLSNVQNSSGKGSIDIAQNLKIFDVNDFLPKVRTYTPRTAIDYSKYKTIQRTPSTHTTTEAFFEDDNADIVKPILLYSSENPIEELILPTTEKQIEMVEVSRKRSTTEPTTTTTSTTPKLLRTRRRRPSTTPKPNTTSTAPRSEAIHTTNAESRRVYRRRPTHIRTSSTSEKTKGDPPPEKSQKIVRRRHNSDESTNREPKIISLETIIREQSNQTLNNDTNTKKTLSSNEFANRGNKSGDISVDDILKNINRLTEINIEEVAPEYTIDGKFSEDDLVYDENSDNKDEYFDDDSKIMLDNENVTNKKLVISKGEKREIYNFDTVR